MSQNNNHPGDALHQMMAHLLHPPIFIRLFRAFTFPAIVMTRHDLGERYYRNSKLGRIFFYAACLPIPFFISGLTFFISVCLGLTAAAWHIRCNFNCRREIKARKRAGIGIHSMSMGVPRFGLANNLHSTSVLIPTWLMLLGLICMPLSIGLGCYMLWSGLGLYSEAAWCKHLANEAEMDAIDAQIETDAPVTSSSMESFLDARPSADRQAASNPLAGFEEVLSKAKSK